MVATGGSGHRLRVEIVRRQGALAQAIECNDEARAIATQYGFKLAGAVAAMNLGATHLDIGDLVQARGGFLRRHTIA